MSCLTYAVPVQLTLVNTDYLRAVTSSGDEWQLAASYLPSVMRSTLRRLIHEAGNVASSMPLLTDVDCSAVDQWHGQLYYPSGFKCLSFSAWLANNDTVDKADMMSEFASTPLNISHVTAIYAALTGCPDLFTNLSCLYFDDSSTSFSTTPISDFTRALLEARNDNVSSDSVTATDVVASALCSNSFDGSSCFEVPPDQRLAATYVRVLRAYVVTHLAAYAFHRAVHMPGNDLIVTRSQSQLALGDGHRSSGVLEHYIDAPSASNTSHLVTVYNCYDAILAVSNGYWKCKYSSRLVE